MSIALYLDRILDLMAVLDAGMQAGISVDDLLNQALRAAPDCLPPAQGARLYRIDQNVLRLHDSTDIAAPNPIALSPLSNYDRIFELRVPTHHSVNGSWLAPLYDGDERIGLLEVLFDPSNPVDPVMGSWLRLVADRVSVLIHVSNLLTEAKQARDMADYLVLLSRLVATAENYNDMVQAAVYTIARQMTGVAITLFDQPLDARSQPQSRAVVGLSGAEGGLEIKHIEYRAEMPDKEQFENLKQGLPVIENDFENGGLALSARIRQIIAPDDQNVVWLAAFGLRAGDRMLGTLEILHHENYQLSPEEVDAYNTLADQIGISVRSRQLLQQTSETLDETRTLYEVNSAMIGAQDTLDVLRALYMLAPDATHIDHTAIQYDSWGEVEDLISKHAITPEGEQVIHTSLGQFYDRTSFDAARKALEGTALSVIFVEDTAELPADYPASLANLPKQQDVGSSIVIPVYERDVLRDLIQVSFAHPQTFDGKSHRLYEALADQISIIFQNQRLLQEAQVSASQLSSQVRFLQTLNQVATTVSTVHEEQQLFDETVRALVTATGADHGNVFLIDPSERTATIASEYPLEEGVGNPLDMDVFPLYQGIRRRETQSILIEDVDGDPRLSEASRQLLQSLNIKSMLMLPLFVQERLIGAISLHIRASGRYFSQAMIDIARTITAQVSIGLQNIRLLTKAQRQSEQLQRVNQFGQSLQATLDLAVILETALTECGGIIAVDRMSIALRDEDDDILRTAALYANGENYLTMANGTPVLTMGSIVGRAWERREFLHIPDVMQEPGLIAGETPELHSLMVMPMYSHARGLGVVTVGCEYPYAYTETDVVVFQQMAGVLAAAIENAVAYRRSQRQAKNEGLVNDISGRLQQQTDIESMLNVTMNELGKALGARRARIRLGTLETDGDDI